MYTRAWSSSDQVAESHKVRYRRLVSALRRLFGASSRSDPTPHEARPEPEVSGGLASRMAIASLLLALLVGTAFTVLLFAISDLRASGRLVTHSREANAAADRLEELVIDLETGVRGFVIARQERFLEPWKAARAAFQDEARALEQLADQPEQRRRARSIVLAIAAYITDYSVPLVRAARQNKPAARSIPATLEGKLRIDALRRSFDRFRSVERALLAKRQRRDDTNAGRAVTAATVGLAGSLVLILGFGGYLARAIVRPLRRASRLAGKLADGKLGTRMPERSVGEIGALEPPSTAWRPHSSRTAKNSGGSPLNRRHCAGSRRSLHAECHPLRCSPLSYARSG